MDEDVGVFIHLRDTDVEQVIRGCKEILESVDCNNAFITGVMRDSHYGGFRVYLSEESVVEQFLKLRYLPLSDERASIHSLTTKLTVHDVMPDSESDFKEMLRNHLERFDLRPVLDICSIPASPEYPTIRSGNWLLELDMPEIEDLDVFKNSGLPDCMKLPFTIKGMKREKRVTFFCCLCHDIEHSREQCQELLNRPLHENRETPRASPEAYTNSPQFETRERSPTVPPASTSKSAKRIRIESIVGNLQKQNNASSQKSSSIGEVKIKQEPEDEDTYSRLNPRVVLKRACVKNENDYNSKSKKMKYSTHEKNKEENIRFDGSPAASSTTGKDDNPVIVFESPRRSSSTERRYSEDSTSFQFDGEYGGQDDSNALTFNLPTSSQPETSSDQTYNEIFPKEASDFSDSGDTVRAKKSKRKKPVYAPVVLPKRIKQIIQSREKKPGELTIGELEAFFNHVKKKMSPAKIGKQFTDDVLCLKDQIKWIVQQYYMTPKAGSGEDSRFMKWLEGMLERFDSVPSKRKKLKNEPED